MRLVLSDNCVALGKNAYQKNTKNKRNAFFYIYFAS